MRKLALIFILVALLSLLVACGSKGVDRGKAVKSAPAGNNLTVTLSTPDGVLHHGNGQTFMLSFTDASGKTVEVGAAALTFHMPAMGAMGAMNNASTLTTTNTPGVYRGLANVEMAGEWQAQVTYEGPAGRGQVSLPVTAQ
ncbi:MAG: hypothetical protein AUG51_23280 [Acidobacteria bacterium 13_1_20CM_3_53_8]|nr:MAG: hypothetical protein AUG51_23280 [Acidobacteria bacterium 13_1_20CM_3_53_8]